MPAFYLSYYYVYLFLYDYFHKTNFSNSQPPEVGGVPSGGTGNFPGHPRLIRRYFEIAQLNMSEPVLDVGHGSGIVLHVAKHMGFLNLSGIEFSSIAYDISKKNLDSGVRLLHGNALDIDLTAYSAITFFSPFRGEIAKKFFMHIPAGVKTIITVNHDLIIEPILINLGFNITYSYQHLIYKNFNAKIWKR